MLVDPNDPKLKHYFTEPEPVKYEQLTKMVPPQKSKLKNPICWFDYALFAVFFSILLIVTLNDHIPTYIEIGKYLASIGWLGGISYITYKETKEDFNEHL